MLPRPAPCGLPTHAENKEFMRPKRPRRYLSIPRLPGTVGIARIGPLGLVPIPNERAVQVTSRLEGGPKGWSPSALDTGRGCGQEYRAGAGAQTIRASSCTHPSPSTSTTKQQPKKSQCPANKRLEVRVSLPVETVRLGQYGHDGRTPIIIGNPVRPSIHVPTPRHSAHPDKLRHSLTTYLDHWIPCTRFEIRFKESPSSTFSSCADRGSNLHSLKIQIFWD